MTLATDAELLATKIAQFTVAPSGGTPASTPDVVVVVHQNGDVRVGFERARERLAAKQTVRLLGLGVTSPRTWPSWVSTAEGLALTELGALQWGPQAAITGPLQDEMRAWIRTVCGRAFGTLPAERVLFVGACSRFLQPYLTQFMTARPVAMAFASASVEHVGDDGTALESTRRSTWRARASILGWGVAALVGSVVDVAKAYGAAAPSFREIDGRRRAKQARQERQATWVALVPDWYRMNHHLLEALALPETEDQGTLGLLLVGSLHPGRRDESNLRVWHDTDQLWPGLGELRERLDRCTVEQAVMPRSRIAFAQAVGTGVARACRIIGNLAADPCPSFGGSRFDLGGHARAVTTWATLDVLRATLGEAATADLTARIGVSGADVVFAASNSPQVAAVDLALQRAGARTVNHEHGAGGDSFSGIGATESSVRCLWTAADARSAERASRTTLVTGMPVRIRLAPRQHPPRRVLVMSNYLHRDSMIGSKHFPLEPFYVEMQETARLIARDPEVEIRLRPHPADDDATLRRLLESCPGFALSRGVPIEHDAAWADVIVTSMSTVLFEVLFAGVPIFVHAQPSLRNLPATDFFDPGRIFLRAEDGAAAVEAWRRSWMPTGSHIEPELRARAALFGPTGEPEPMTSHFGRRARLKRS